MAALSSLFPIGKILLMEDIVPDLGCINFVNMGNYLSPGAGFHPSTVCSWWIYPTVERALFFCPGAIHSTNEHTTSFLLILPFLKVTGFFFGSLVKEISPLQAESYDLKPLMWEDSDWDLFWWQPTAQLTQTTYSDPPTISTFSPWVCFWWWRDSNFTPFGGFR